MSVVLEALVGDLEHAADQFGAVGNPQRRVVEERVDRGQTGIAGANAVATFGFEVGEERGDRRRVEIVERELDGCLAGAGAQTPAAAGSCRGRRRSCAG